MACLRLVPARRWQQCNPAGQQWIWAELREVRLEVLLEESEAELLTVALENLGRGWGALHLALHLSSHFLEHLESAGLGESRG